MTCSQCPHCLAEIARLDGELAKARAERDEAREASGIIKWADDTRLSIKIADDRDSAQAEVSRLKAGLVEMRTVVAGPHEIEWHHTVRLIDALLKEST